MLVWYGLLTQERALRYSFVGSGSVFHMAM